jgi:hypothetical protein
MTEPGNIGPREQARRRRMGVYSLAAGVGVAAALALWGFPRWTRLAAFFPFWAAALGLLQAQGGV